LPILSQAQVLNILPIDEDVSIVRVIETLDQLDDGTLARARRANDGSGLSELELEGEIFKDMRIRS